MPLVDCVVECQVHDSFRVQQVAGMFDVTLTTKASERFSVEVPDDDGQWKIGAIVGPSGSGKSTIAGKAYGASVYRVGNWPAKKAVIDCFGDHSVKDIATLLTAVGFSSPPAWVKPYTVLSNGEKFRCDLARALLSKLPLVVFDEYSSVVDRTVAKIGSAALSKAVRRLESKRFVAVTCHYDVVDWLEPDWVLDMASGQLARGRLWRRPPIAIRLFETSHRNWRVFAKHHYLNAKQIPGSRCYVGEIEGQPACFVSVRSSVGHPGVRRISRIVTMPDFQGVGIGMACLNAVAEITLRQPNVERVTIVTGHPGMMHGLANSARWACARFLKVGSAINGTQRNVKSSTGRAVAGFRFIPLSEPAQSRPVHETDQCSRTTGRAPPAAADFPAASTTDPTQTDPPRPWPEARSRRSRRSRSETQT